MKRRAPLVAAAPQLITLVEAVNAGRIQAQGQGRPIDQTRPQPPVQKG